jgi:ATP-binding cassette, subfamily B, bacterial HlyB/CyaB
MIGQTNSGTALKALAAVARHHGVDLSAERLAHEYAVGGGAVGLGLLARMARDAGFKARARRLKWRELTGLGTAYPVLARLSDGNTVIVSGHRKENGGDEIAIVDPLAQRPGFVFLDRKAFEAKWGGETLLLRRTYDLADEGQPFGLRWFVPEMLKRRGTFANVALAALLLLLLGLVTPIFFQLVIDKVLVHSSVSTLHALGVGIIVAVVFESIFGYLRNYLLLHATNKIDTRLTVRTFNHLLSLPLSFFETSSAGVLTKHMGQTETIREFLTGKLFLTLLDAMALFVFVPILAFYSGIMTAVVLAFSALVAIVIAAVLPVFRKNLERLYRAEGERQAMLVETIHGMRTVKALALEPAQRRTWDERTAQAIASRFNVGKVSVGARTVVGLIERLLTIAIVWIGAELVFAGSLSVGELVAIQMLAGRVSGPLVQLVSLVNEFQQTSLSLRMLGEIMNKRPERTTTVSRLQPRLAGQIEFDRVRFHYPTSPAPALDDISVTIPPGSFIGIVGRTGSGKSTFTRLIQGLYLPTSGNIRFDNVDSRELDLPHLRRSVGVVLQESFLFRGTVRENIAVTRPDASFAEIVGAAQAAGAHEFIQRLPQGYDTPLEENATNLSGGQKQRLSIARALLPEPPILVFDEATSALDPESEAIVQDNLAQIARGRTVLMVSHRLSSLTQADQILVFERGEIVSVGTHAELVRKSPVYRQLWSQQTRHLGPAALTAVGAES